MHDIMPFDFFFPFEKQEKEKKSILAY